MAVIEGEGEGFGIVFGRCDDCPPLHHMRHKECYDPTRFYQESFGHPVGDMHEPPPYPAASLEWDDGSPVA